MDKISQNIENLKQIIESNRQVANEQQIKIKRLNNLKMELDLYKFLQVKYKNGLPTITDGETALADEAVNMLDNFDTQYAPFIRERVSEYNRQVTIAAKEVFNKEEAVKIIDRYANGIRTFLSETALAEFNKADEQVKSTL